ncbi:MAG: cellulase family glycosylhydrolase [Fimbriimonadaceae bacterium]|nr:cellulase family glycosylhydrolase [Fimbriimonadaceae bacterium]
MTAPLFLLLATTSAGAQVWYGPGEATLDVVTSGNPYDTQVNDVRVKFTGPAGESERFAYFDGKAWKVRLAAPLAGSYTGTVTVNGHESGRPVSLTLTKAEPGGYVRVNAAKDGFVTSSGQAFWPVGINIGWDSGPQMTVLERLAKLGEAGGNWSRIWQCPWDAKNPFWAEGIAKPKLGEIVPQVYAKWDKIVRAAEARGIKFQWVLHHHGLFSSTVNPNWPDHPWNVKNGGFLAKADAFFTDPRARKYTKDMLRYVVARYGDSPSVMAWELFNEVQFTDAARNGHWDTVAAWHDEMAQYLKSIDPYHHLVTTSSELDKPIWRSVDYYQPHGYPADVTGMVVNAAVPKDKPFFYGEVGFGGNAPDTKEYRAVTGGVMAAALRGHAGAAQYWYWDRLGSSVPWETFKTVAAVAKRLPHPLGLTMAHVVADRGGDLVIAPGRGWEKSEASAFDLPADAEGALPGKLSSFLQGKAHPEMGSPTLEFRLDENKPYRLSVHFAGSAQGGTTVDAYLDGKSVGSLTWPADGRGAKTLDVTVPSGRHVVKIVNAGADWAQIAQVRVEGLGRKASGYVASSKGETIVAYVVRNAPGPVSYSIAGKLPSGLYDVELVDLRTGASRHTKAAVKPADNRLGPLPALTTDDLVLIAHRTSK